MPDSLPQVLSQSVVGQSRDQIGDDEEEAADVSGAANSSGGCYEVVGSLLDGSAGKPNWASEIVEVIIIILSQTASAASLSNFNFTLLQTESRDTLSATLQSCDVIVYNIGDGSDQVEEATWAVQSMYINSTLHIH